MACLLAVLGKRLMAYSLSKISSCCGVFSLRLVNRSFFWNDGHELPPNSSSSVIGSHTLFSPLLAPCLGGRFFPPERSSESSELSSSRSTLSSSPFRQSADSFGLSFRFKQNEEARDSMALAADSSSSSPLSVSSSLFLGCFSGRKDSAFSTNNRSHSRTYRPGFEC